MSKVSNLKIFFRINTMLALIGGGYALWGAAGEPSEAQTIFFWNYSLSRLVLIALIVFLMGAIALSFLLSFRAQFDDSQIAKLSRKLLENKSTIAWGVFCSFVFYFLLFFQNLHWNSWLTFRDRLYPVLIWFTVLALQIIVSACIWRGLWISGFKAYKDVLTWAVFVYIAFGILVFGIAWSRIGLAPDAVYWQEPGVPLLMWQVLLAWGIGGSWYIWRDRLLVTRWGSRLKSMKPYYQDLILCAMIWLFAFTFWVTYPIKPSYNSLEPYAPNFQSYPFGDAIIFDVNAQNYFIGIPIPNDFWQKPFYSFFLVILHGFAQQNYEFLVQLQVAVFALIPVLLYLLVKMLSGRATGLVAAMLITFRELNAMALSNVIQVSNSKLLMSDDFALGLVILLTMLLVKWLKNPNRNRMLPMVIGGVLGFLVLTRGHTLLLLPFIGLASALVLIPARQYRSLVEGLLILGIGLSVPLGVWIWRNYQWSGSFSLQDPVSPYTLQIARLYSLTPLQDPVRLPGEEILEYYNRVKGQPLTFIKEHPGDVVHFISAHYLHNMIYSFIYLPLSFRVEGPVDYVNRMPFWTAWEGYFPKESRVFLWGNLFILALGLSITWRKTKYLFSVPLLTGIGYNLSVSVGRLSGWRLILPADWITLVFYAAGLMQLFLIARSLFVEKTNSIEVDGVVAAEDTKEPWNWKMFGASLLIFLIFSLGLTEGHALFPVRYPEKNARDILQDYKDIVPAQQSAISVDALQDFLEQNEAAVALYGRGLYPTYLPAKKGELNYFYLAFARRDYKRLVFQLIGQNDIGVVLPLESRPERFPNASDVIVFGCYIENEDAPLLPGYIDALAVIVKTEPPVIYTRSPFSDLACPSSLP